MENEESLPVQEPLFEEESLPVQEPLFEIQETPFVPIESQNIDYIAALEGFVLVILICMILLGIVQKMNK